MENGSPSHFASYPSLRDQVVLITGGATGIGASFVSHFAGQGAKVAFLDIQRETGEALAADLASACRHPPAFSLCDLTDVPAVRKTITELVSAMGTPKVLINNAANDDRHVTEEVTPEYWDRCMQVNLRHQFFATQAVIPYMKEGRRGSIVNMGSIAPIVPAVCMAGYIAAKSAIPGLTKMLSKELGQWEIRVNAILPGAIQTERQTRLWLTPKFTEQTLAAQSLRRLLQPEEVARLALFLASDDSSAITGQCYIIDGGRV